ncbi:MAG: hypothetical protein K8T89_02050 [Planctomycetes bacterium]|nr:hypothetical protein [Planctomycetota bacterium]
MSILTLELKEEQVDRLKKKAGRLGLSVESYASKVLVHLSESDREHEIGSVDPKTFERLLQASIKENDEAYRRLAQ